LGDNIEQINVVVTLSNFFSPIYKTIVLYCFYSE
jgi:hypothetical protein